MKEQLAKIRAAALEAIADSNAAAALDSVRVKYLGKKGELTSVLKQMGKLSAEERPVIGQIANEVRETLTKAIADQQSKLAEKALEAKLASETLDVSIPGIKTQLGHRHPVNQVIDMVTEIFLGMGFTRAEGPEVELADYNFTRLNTDEGHPAREWSDTFYLREDSSLLLRTQTSPMQIRTMEKQKPPIRVIAPGRVYRSDAVDATHSPVFHQIEGLVVDKGITMGDLKGTLEVFAKRLYGEEARVRFRPHHFPFTEPSAEMDVTCFKCHGAGCPLCKGEGFIEILGCGMVHPKVLSVCGIDPEEYSGFAFGIGLERIVMQRYKIDDLRLFYEDDLRFLTQF